MEKFSAVLVFALVLASTTLASEECIKRIDEYKTKCKNELKLTDNDVKGLDMPEPFLNGTKCLIKCIAENFEIFVNGSLVEAKVMNLIDTTTKSMPLDARERDIKIYKECKDQTGECPCEIAAKMYTCVRETFKKMMGNKKMR